MYRLIVQFLLVLTLVFGFALPAHAQADDWSIKLFESRITLQSDGVLKFQEIIRADFGSASKHGIYRDIPYLYSQADGEHYTEVIIKSVERNDKDEPYEVSKSDANLRIKIGDADRTISGQQTYTITYTVAGVITAYNDFDELYWNVTGNEWEVGIEVAHAYVSLPADGVAQAACYEGFAGSTSQCTTTSLSGRQTEFQSTHPLAVGEGMTIAVGFTKGMVPILALQKPKEPYQILTEELAKPPYWLLAMGALVAGIATPVWWWWRKGSDWWWQVPAMLESNQRAWLTPFGHRPQVVVEFEPPETLRPAQMGALLDQRADTLDITSTIIDLASRGYLTIKELSKTWALGAGDYQLDLTDKAPTDLLPYEQKLLQRMFGSDSTVTLSTLKNTFYNDLAVIKNEVYDDLMKRNYFVAHPQKVRATYIGIGFGLLFVAGGTGWAGYTLVWAWVFVLAVVPLIAGLALLVLSAAMPQRTALGYELYRRVLGYKLFIGTAEKYRQQFFEKQNIFTQALPYAMMFGLTAKFAQALQQIGYQPVQPTWYSGLHAFNIAQFTSDMNSVSKALSSSMASAPSSSGSGGGGSSGGGFGGGGGGSW